MCSSDLAGLAGLAAGVGAGWGLGRFLQAGGAPSSAGAIVRENGHWFPVARLSEIGDHATLRFTAGALEGNLVLRGREVTALSSVCSHLPCTLVWREQDDDFLCPCHDIPFNADGSPKSVPPGHRAQRECTAKQLQKPLRNPQPTREPLSTPERRPSDAS